MKDLDKLSDLVVAVEPPPFLINRIESKIARRKNTTMPTARAWSIGLLLLSVLVMDYAVLSSKWHGSNQSAETTLIEIPDHQLYHE
jgi:hypothetical protein